MYEKVDALVAANKVSAQDAQTFKDHNSPNATADIACECETCKKIVAA